MGGQGWAARGAPGSGQKKSKNKFKKPGDKPKSPKDIDAQLRGQRQALDRRISFVPAKRAENGYIAAVLGGPGEAKAAHVKNDASPSAGTGGGKKRPAE